MTAPSSSASNAMHRVEALLDLLICPECRSRLVLDADAGELICTGADCGLIFAVTEEGVPVLLIDEARRPEPPPPPDPPSAPDGTESPGDGSTVA